MTQSNHLFGLLLAMGTTSAPITAARLAETTEVSVRSLYRDTDAYRSADRGSRASGAYGYKLVEDYALPPGMAGVRSIDVPVLAEGTTSVLAKMTATLPGDREQYLLHRISHVLRSIYSPGRRPTWKPYVAHADGRRRCGSAMRQG